MQLQGNRTVREMVLANPSTSRVFERFGIDYCCGGNKSLAEACSSAKVNMQEVAATLDKPLPGNDECDWAKASLAELASYIVTKHHGFTRQEVRRLTPLLAKVIGVHGGNHEELHEIRTLFAELAQEMTMHMMKEEHMLFPYIEELEAAVNRGVRPVRPMFGTVQNPVRMMMMEHDSSGKVQHKIRELTNDFAPPADACVSYQTLYKALQEFEADMHQHIHLENSILFPRAVELEASVS
jgi:regulator of cell morphogenesis and NO signaling